jgi:hypothetical protein
MGERTEQIEREIAQERDSLGRNLNELERRVKSAGDWRVQFDRHPMAMMGLAFGGGLILSAVLGEREESGRRRDWNEARWRAQRAERALEPERRRSQRRSWYNMKLALVGVATDRVRNFMEELVPGFREHYRRAEAQNRSAIMPPIQPRSPAG